MSQKRIWIDRLRHTRQIENHHKKDQILVYPNFFDRKSFRLKIKNDVYFSLSEVLSLTVSTHFSSKSVVLGDLLNKLPPSQWLILAKSTKFRHASFTSETQNVHSAKAPR